MRYQQMMLVVFVAGAAAVFAPDASAQSPHNGSRIRTAMSPIIYLVDNGQKRQIPNEATYNGLFRDWNNILVVADIDAFQTGQPLSEGAVLVRADDGPRIYLVANGVKRHIVDEAAMNKYAFNWQQVRVVPRLLIDYIPNGPSIW